MRKKELKQEKVIALLEGDPGSGKTRLADTANLDPRMAPALHLDMRGNTVTLASVPGQHQVLEIESVKDIERIYNWLAGQPHPKPQEGSVLPTDMVSLMAEYFPGQVFQTLILDTLTQYHHMTLDAITGNVNKRIGQETKQPQIQDWGELLRQTVLLMGKLGELPLHVVVTVQSSEERDNVTGQVMHRPQLWGKSVKEVPAFVYIHAYLLQALRLTQRQRMQIGLEGEDVDPNTRVALFTPRFDSMAKDQYGVLGPHMIDPSFPKICDLIYGPSTS